jgi:Iap family predicted aminopeptidase
MGRLAVAILAAVSLVAAPVARAEISGDRAKRFVRQLAALGPRPAGSLAERRAAGMVRTKLAAFGYDVRIQRFRLPSGRYSRNVVGRSPGPLRVLVVAHLDGVHGTVAANDNGSGVATMLEVARELAGREGVRVAALGAEERVVTGSRYHLGSLRLVSSIPRTVQDSIRFVVSLDMVGVGPTLNVRGLEASPNRSARRLLRRARAIGLRASYLRDSGLSDHAEITRRGIPGAWLTWRWDVCWHSPCDRPNRLSALKLRQTGRLTLVAARAALD